MSSQKSIQIVNKNKNAKTAPVVKYCAHCFNLGKPIEVYQSHYIRASPEPNSPVVCPELLATQCRNCLLMGHTVSRCPRARSFNNATNSTNKVSNSNSKSSVVASSKVVQSCGKFAALMDCDDDNEKPIVVMKSMSKAKAKEEEFPVLTGIRAKVPEHTSSISYANVAAKTKTEYNESQLKYKMTQNVAGPKVQAIGKSILVAGVYMTHEQCMVEFADNYINAEDDDVVEEVKPAVVVVPYRGSWDVQDSESDSDNEAEDEDW